MTPGLARLLTALGHPPTPDDETLDKPINLDPDHPTIAAVHTHQAERTAPAMTIEELLGPDLDRALEDLHR